MPERATAFGAETEQQFSLLAPAVGATLVLAFLALAYNRLPGRPVDGFGALVRSLRWSVPISLAVLLPRVRNALRPPWLPDSRKFLALALGLCVGGYGYPLYVWINAGLDRGEPEVVTVRVTEKWTPYRNWSATMVRLEDWRDGAHDTTYEVSFADYEKIAPGVTRARLTIMPGFLGTPWIRRMEFADE